MLCSFACSHQRRNHNGLKTLNLIFGQTLRIGPKQEAEWRALVRAVRAEAAQLAPLCATWQQTLGRPLPERLAGAEAALRQSADALARLRPVIDALYRELDPARKRLFDRMLQRRRDGR